MYIGNDDYDRTGNDDDRNVDSRYNAMKAKLAASQARLQDFHAIVKLKNPSLLLQIQQKGGIWMVVIIIIG